MHELRERQAEAAKLDKAIARNLKELGYGGEWETVPLEQLVLPNRGISYGIVQPGSSVADGVPIVRVNDVRNGRISTASPMRVAPSIESAYSRTRLQGGELLLTLVGTVGETAVVPDSLRGWNTARAVGVIPVRSEIGAYWVQLVLQTPSIRHLIDSRLNTTVQATFNLGDVAKLPIILPPRTEREKIAHILGTLDDKIELNRRMNETLEGMARALFQSWFVDFDPVVENALRAGNPIPERFAARADYLRERIQRGETSLPHAPSVADAFPDSFQDSELGEIPRGWSIGRCGDLVEVLREQENPLDSPATRFSHHSIPAFDDKQTPKIESGDSIKSFKFRVPVGTVLLSKLNPEIERVWLVDVRSGDRAVCSTEFLVFRPRIPFTRAYVYCFARSPLFRQQIEGLVTGTSKSHQRAQPESVLNVNAVFPPPRAVEAFEHLAATQLERTLVCRAETRALTALRDALLPKLISGELRVKDAERCVEAEV